MNRIEVSGLGDLSSLVDSVMMMSTFFSVFFQSLLLPSGGNHL